LAGKTISVVIADDHRLFAQALEAILSTDGRLEVVGVAGNGREAVALADERHPDVVVMDLSMPVMDGFEATEAITSNGNGSRVLVLTGSDSTADVARAREAGAAAYLTKDHVAQDVVRAIVDLAGL
jgi:DNA-binding NarL/FixJ family response regulator